MVLLLVLVLRWTAPVNHGEFGLLGHFERNRFHMEITITNCPMTPYSPKSHWLAINLSHSLYTVVISYLYFSSSDEASGSLTSSS